MNTRTFSLEQLVGKSLQGYTVHQLLGSDTLNAVYIAQQGSQRPVLLKAFLLPTELPAEALTRFQQRFMEMAARLASLDHPHILPLYAYGEEYGFPYMITSAPADTTSSLAKLLQKQGPFSPEYTLELFQQIAAALGYARFQDVTHGSLESAYVLLDREQNVQLTNFGLTHMLSLRSIEENERPYAHLFNVAGTFLGAPAYMAPEVVDGKTSDERSDVYALGILLYELLSGSLPFTGEDPMAIAFEHIEQPVPPLRMLSPALSEALDFVIQQSIEHDPGRRYQTAGKLVTALEQALQSNDQVDLAPARARLSLSFSLPSVPSVSASKATPAGAESQKFVQRRGGLLSGQTSSALPASETLPADVESREGTGQRRGLLSNSSAWQTVSPPSVSPADAVVPVASDASGSSGPVAGESGGEESGSGEPGSGESGGWQLRPPIVTSHLATPKVAPRPPSIPGVYPPLPDAALLEKQMVQPAFPAAQQESQLSATPENEAPSLSDMVAKAKYLVTHELTDVEKAKQLVAKTKLLVTQELAEDVEKAKELVAQELSDPLFAMSATSMMASAQSPSMTTPDAYTPVLPDLPEGTPPMVDKGRRRTLAVLATGGVVTLGLLGLGGLSLNHFLQSQPESSPRASSGTDSPMVTQQNGTVIGKQQQALNSAVKFINPTDKQASLLIHLPNGNFVAYESTCTHQAVAVTYDKKRHLLVCPRHKATFDPAANGKVLKGPAKAPLKPIKLSIKADGSISPV